MLKNERQYHSLLVYEEVKLDCGYKLYFIANKKVIIEIKSLRQLNNIHPAQILNYIESFGMKVWIAINFHMLELVNGLKRVVNNS